MTTLAPTDAALELLCLLSPTPSRSDDLIKDLHLPSRLALRYLTDDLRHRGYAVTRVGRGGGSLVLPGREMPKVERACVEYLAAHGE